MRSSESCPAELFGQDGDGAIAARSGLVATKNAVVGLAPTSGASRWLVLLFLGVVLDLLRSVTTLLKLDLSTGSTIADGVVVAAWLVTSVLFFKKKRAFRPVYVVAALFTIVVRLRQFVDSVGPEPTREQSGALFGMALPSIIWIVYVLSSVRVKSTFRR